VLERVVSWRCQSAVTARAGTSWPTLGARVLANAKAWRCWAAYGEMPGDAKMLWDKEKS
jgi:hypothetical protein